MMTREQIISRDDGILGGIPVFAGTRVPIQNFFDCLRRGYSVDEFLADFPTVERSQVIALLDLVREEYAALA